MLGGPVPWDEAALKELCNARTAQRSRGNAQPMPARIDAALFLVLADALLQTGDREQALIQIGNAVEAAPGLPDLIEYEEGIRRGQRVVLALQRFVLGEPGVLERPPEPPATDPL